MKTNYNILIVSLFSTLSSATCLEVVSGGTQISNPESSTCPTWHVPSKVYGLTVCECGFIVGGVVTCYEWNSSVSLLACYCMSQSKLLNKTVVGNCLYTCPWKYRTALSNETSALDNEICLPFKRTGQLCGECIPDYAPPIYSYNIECVKCTSYAINWLKYIAAAFLPLTLFYLIIVVFRISASSPRLRCIILVCQMITMPGQLRYIYALQQKIWQVHKIEVMVAMSLLSVWNLEFFRAVYNPFCIHPHVNSLGVLAMDYLTAVYPLFLIFITFCCIKLYDKFAIIRLVLKPIHRCFFRIRKEWNIHRSLTDAFATFLLLSYVKILNISFDLLIPTTIYDINGDKNKNFLYYSGNVQVFKGEHIPFAILAVIMATVFNVIPLVLISIYHCNRYQKLVNYCNCHCQTLHVFMDIFNSCYRTKPVDCRHFSVVYLVVRIVNLLLFSFTLSRFYYPFAAILSLLSAILVTTVQPYKSQLYNKLDTVLLLMFTLAYIPATAYALSPTDKLNKTFLTIITLTCCCFIFYIASIMVYWATPQRIKERMKVHIKQLYQRCTLCSQPTALEEDFLDTTDYFNASRELTDTTYQIMRI